MIFPVEEVCGGKGMIDKCPFSSSWVGFQVIIHRALGLPRRHLQDSENLRQGGVLTETG
jgi:hypothetical protein